MTRRATCHPSGLPAFLFTGLVSLGVPAAALASPIAFESTSDELVAVAPNEDRDEDSSVEFPSRFGDAASSPEYADDDCTLRYTDGRLQWAAAGACDGVRQCASTDELQACSGDQVSSDCVFLAECSCNYEEWVSHGAVAESDEDIYLAGVPDLWTSGYRNSASLAMGSMLYWWSQRGYTDLTDDAMTSSGLHDWDGLVEELHVLFRGSDWALDPTIVVPQVLSIEGSSYLEAYDLGANLRHYKVCSGCSRNDPYDLGNELGPRSGLNLIKAELRSGRPLIMRVRLEGRGVNVPVYNDGELIEDVWTGLLFARTLEGARPAYVVVTGYVQTDDGTDLITVNMNDGGDADTYLVWNPGSAWVDLWALDIEAPPTTSWCAIDSGIEATFAEPYGHWQDLELSHSDRSPRTPLAGQSCGVVNDREVVTTAETYEPGYTCQTEWQDAPEVEFIPPERDDDPRLGLEDYVPGTNEAQVDSIDGGNPYVDAASQPRR